MRSSALARLDRGSCPTVVGIALILFQIPPNVGDVRAMCGGLPHISSWHNGARPNRSHLPGTLTRSAFLPGAGPDYTQALPPLEPGVPLANKPTTRFVCQSCGAVTPKWAGRCETCGEWNTVEPEAITPGPGAASRKSPAAASSVNFVGLRGDVAPPPRAVTGIEELDRVLGGGLVPASAVLVGGDPGIGKSTLLLQAAARLARFGRRVLYVSGEESVD